MRKEFSRFAAVLFFTCYLFTGTASSQSLPLKHYTIKDDLASASVNTIFQDSKGFLWIGTEKGLSRFDGSEFKNFYIKNGLPNDFITDIWEDREGNIWMGTPNSGLARFSQGMFKNFTEEDGLANNSIVSITGDEAGNLWIGTRMGVSKFNGKNFISFKKKDGLVDNYITEIICAKDGALWIATVSGISHYTGDRFINYTKENGLIDDRVRALVIDFRGNLWVGTRGGISCLQKGKFTSYTIEDGLAGNVVNAIIEDRNKNIWIATDNGLSYFSAGRFSNFYIKHGLLDDKIYTIFEGREGNIWIGTNMGLSRLHSLRFVNFSIDDGLPNNLAWAICEERPGRYWIGTDNGLSLFSAGKFTNFTTTHGLAGNSIYKLLKDKPGNIWIGTNNGLSVYSGGKFYNYTTKNGLLHDTIITLAEDRQGTVWIGTLKGLCGIKDGKIKFPPFEQEELPIQALLVDSKGVMWFSNNRGLFKLAEDMLSRYTTNDGLIHQFIKAVFEDSRGRLWIGTDQGLSCYSAGKFTNYTTAQGLSDNVCYFVLEDDNQNIWIGTGKGVNRFDGTSFKTYTTRDGLASDEMGQKACLKDSRGYLWFGTVNGISRFNPKLDRVNTVPPPVYITGYNVFGREQPLGDDFVLKHDQNYLGFNFTGISFTSPEDVTYKYRLEGINQDWIETKNPDVSYAYLPPGEHTFEVTAINNDGVESIKPAELKFKILPPFWETWWFRGLALLVLVSITVQVVRWRIRRVREKMANEARNKQLIMAQKMELVGILAGGAVHDLKNLLAIIIGYSKIAVQSVDQEETKSRPIEKIKTTAMTAVSVVKQILAFTRQKYDETRAANLPDLLDDILEILKITTPPEVKILWQRPQEEIRLFINPTKFQQVVMNLCLNAVQAMEEGGGELRILLSKDETGRIFLEIADSGGGMEPEVAEKIFDPLFTTKEPGKGTGLGLFVVKQIVDECKGKIEVESKPGAGATFKISFPPAKKS